MASASVTNKLINNPEDAVDENLSGFVSTNPHIKLLPSCGRVIIRRDVTEYIQKGHVTLICGGGSGHEPVFAGYVGNGGLTAAIAGNIFASPPPNHILHALRATKSLGGMIIYVFNYTGDRLNFGIALERFRKECDPNIPIEMVILGEDCALTSADQSVGRRGLAGSLFVLKICGAMAQAGASFQQMVETSNIISHQIGTIGVSLSSCSLPGSGPLFHLDNQQMELGLGVHGEPGVKRMQLLPAKQTVNIMMQTMTKPESQTRLNLDSGSDVAVLINNLGCMTNIELNIVARETLIWLANRNIAVHRMIVGSMMTSLEMHGVSISVINVMNKEWIKHIDYTVNYVGWAMHSKLKPEIPGEILSRKGKESNLQVDNKDRFCHVDGKMVRKMVESACNCVINAERELNELDSKAGDGDCGSTMRRGAQAILNKFDELDFNIASALLSQLAVVWEESTGGTSGAIYAIFLERASRELESEVNNKSLVNAMIEGTNAIMQYGRAKSGQRTMIDALIVFREFKSMEEKKFQWKQVIERVTEAVSKTAGMVGKAGRSSYVSPDCCRDVDPGAKAVQIWMNAIYDVYCF